MIPRRTSVFSVGAAMLICLGIYQETTAQVTWRKTYGGQGANTARSVRETSDGGSIIAGSTGAGFGGGDIYVIRIDVFGSVIWSRTYGDAGVQTGVSCRELTDGFVIAGSTATGSAGGYDMLLIRTDLEGEPIWERSYGTSDWELCNDMEVASDGFILTGVSYNTGSGDVMVVKTDWNGDTLWTRTSGGAFLDVALGVLVTTDDGVVISGFASSGPTSDNEDAFVAMYSSTGELAWNTVLQGDSADYMYSVAEMPNGDLVGCGSTRSFSPNWQIFLHRLTPAGDLVWHGRYGTVDDYEGREVQVSQDGGLAVAGYLRPFSAGGQDMYLMLINDLGGFILGKNYGASDDEEGFSVTRTSDGGYLTVGVTESYGPGILSIYAVRGDSVGETQIDDVVEVFDPVPVPEAPPSAPRIQVTPNPVRSGEDPIITGLAYAERWTIELFDAFGREHGLFQETVLDDRIALPPLDPGMYFMVLRNGTTKRMLPFFVL